MTDSPAQALDVVGNIRTDGYYDVNGPRIISGTGAPSGSDGSPQGSIYLRTDSGAPSVLYVKTNPTTWTAK